MRNAAIFCIYLIMALAVVWLTSCATIGPKVEMIYQAPDAAHNVKLSLEIFVPRVYGQLVECEYLQDHHANKWERLVNLQDKLMFYSKDEINWTGKHHCGSTNKIGGNKITLNWGEINRAESPCMLPNTLAHELLHASGFDHGYEMDVTQAICGF